MSRPVLHDPGLAGLCALLERRTGLVFHPHQLPLLIEAAAETARQFGHADVHQLAQVLSMLPDGAPELDQLIARVTVGESFFFRDAAQMDFLRSEFLPALIRRRQGHRSLRVWSAAVAAGQELYSVAMLLRELLPDIDSWNLHLRGTDINLQALRSAVEGRYPEWSMRAVDPQQRARHFIEDPGGGARVRPELQGLARFSVLNLAGEGFPSMADDLHSFDLILCRNVFIYFDQQRVHEILARIVRCLAPGGVLMLGASDLVAVHVDGLETVQRDGLCYYRLSRPKDAAPAMPAPAQRTDADALSRLASGSRWRELVSLAERADMQKLRNDAHSCRQVAVAFGNLGRPEEALDWCGRALQLEPTSAEAHYLQALLKVEAGDDAAALEALRRALFLAPDLLGAHHQRALLHLRAGHRERGLRSLRNALSLARRLLGEAQDEDRAAAARRVEIIESELEIHGQEPSPERA
jgi:chemotaxis protein methyltransferase CheR